MTQVSQVTVREQGPPDLCSAIAVKSLLKYRIRTRMIDLWVAREYDCIECIVHRTIRTRHQTVLGFPELQLCSEDLCIITCRQHDHYLGAQGGERNRVPRVRERGTGLILR